MKDMHTLSGAEFKAHFQPLLDGLKDSGMVFFGNGNISFYRFRERGPDQADAPRLVQVAFNEVISVQPFPDED